MVAGVPRQVIEKLPQRKFRRHPSTSRVLPRWPDDWRGSVAELTKYYGWGPCDAWDLPLSRLVVARGNAANDGSGLFNG